MIPAPYTHAAELAHQLRPLSWPLRLQFIEAAVISHAGSFVPAMSGGNWGPHYAELSLLGISHTGDTTEAAVANWIKAALRSEKYSEAMV
jgi:hypothetical protein